MIILFLFVKSENVVNQSDGHKPYKTSIHLLQPVGKHLAILLMSIHKTHMAGMTEQMPTAVRNVLVERGGDNRRTDILRTTTNQCRLGYLAQMVGIFKIFQAAKRLILIGAPTIEVSL